MPGIHHKTEMDGVRLGLTTADEVARAYEDIAARLGPRAIVIGMAQAGIELALGLVHDRQFGPIMVLGAGGTLIEVLRDRRVAIPPLDELRAKQLVDRLKLRPLLAGHRRRPAADLGPGWSPAPQGRPGPVAGRARRTMAAARSR